MSEQTQILDVREVEAAREAQRGWARKTEPDQLQGSHTGYRLCGMGGDDGSHGYERYLRRKSVYLYYEDFGTPADLHP